jgi:hypothetical protein
MTDPSKGYIISGVGVLQYGSSSLNLFRVLSSLLIDISVPKW